MIVAYLPTIYRLLYIIQRPHGPSILPIVHWCNLHIHLVSTPVCFRPLDPLETWDPVSIEPDTG